MRQPSQFGRCAASQRLSQSLSVCCSLSVSPYICIQRENAGPSRSGGGIGGHVHVRAHDIVGSFLIEARLTTSWASCTFLLSLELWAQATNGFRQCILACLDPLPLGPC